MPFEPKHEVKLDPPRDDEIEPEYLAKCDGIPRKANALQCNLLRHRCRHPGELPNICCDQGSTRMLNATCRQILSVDDRGPFSMSVAIRLTARMDRIKVRGVRRSCDSSCMVCTTR